jgi:hypothetical protein
MLVRREANRRHAKYLQTARFYAETNRRNEAVETLEDYILSDVE